MRLPLFVQDCGIVTPLGSGKHAVASALFAGDPQGISLRDDLVSDRSIFVGAVTQQLPALPDTLAFLDCRNNRLMQLAWIEIVPAVERAIARYGNDRVAVVLGTSTSGIATGEDAYSNFLKTGNGLNPIITISRNLAA